MGWVRIDDKFPHNPKILKAGPLGLAMHVAAICYCNQHLTDGFVPNGVTNALLNLQGIAMRCWSGDLAGGGEDAEWQLIVDDLVSAGLWVPTEGGWLVHDYLEYQPSKKDVLHSREVNATRQSRFRNGVTNAVRNGVTNGHVTPAPTPSKNLKKDSKILEDGLAKTREPSRKTRFPADWQPDQQDIAFAVGLGHDMGWIADQAERCRDHHHTNGNSFIDFHGVWRNWVKRAPEFSRPNGKGNGHANGPATQLMRAAADVLAEHEARDAGNHEVAVPLLARKRE